MGSGFSVSRPSRSCCFTRLLRGGRRSARSGRSAPARKVIGPCRPSRSGGRVGPVRPQGVCKGGAAGMLRTLCLQSVLCEWPVGGTGPSPRCPISLIPCHRKPHTHSSCHLLEAPCPVTADPGDLTGVEPVDDKVLFGCTLDGVAGLEAHRCEFGNGRVVHSHPWFSMRSAPGARAWFRLAQHS